MLIDQLKQVNFLDYAVIALYLMMLTGVGIYLTRFNKNVDDFFKGGGRIPWWFSGLSTFVAGFSAFMFVGAAGYTYRNGMSAVLLFTSAVWGYLLGFAIYAVVWRRSRLSSPMEFLTRRFSQSTTYVYTLLSIIPSIMGLGLGIYILCIFIASAMGIMNWTVDLGVMTLTGLEVSMIVTGVVMLIYTSAGGLWAVVITDVLQFFIILIVSILILPLTFLALGDGGGLFHGIARLVQEAPAGFLGFHDVAQRPLFYAAYLISTLIGYNAAWHIGQRYYSVSSERDAKKMALLNAGLSLFLPVSWIVPVMGARILFPDMHAIWPQLPVPSEASFVTLALTLLPNGLIGLTISAILAATMTHTDTALNYLASILVRDVYENAHMSVKKRPPTSAQQLRVGRITVFALGFLAIFTAIIIQRTEGVFDFALKYYSWFTPSMLMPVMLGFIYQKTPSWSALASAIAGLAAVLISNTLIDVGAYQYEVNIFGGVLVSSAVFFLSSFWPERNPETKTVQEAFANHLHTPATGEMTGWSPQAVQSYRIVGILTVGIGIVTLGLGLVPTSADVRLITIGAAVFTACLGGLMVWYFRRQDALFRSSSSMKGTGDA